MCQKKTKKTISPTKEIIKTNFNLQLSISHGEHRVFLFPRRIRNMILLLHLILVLCIKIKVKRERKYNLIALTRIYQDGSIALLNYFSYVTIFDVAVLTLSSTSFFNFILETKK